MAAPPSSRPRRVFAAIGLPHARLGCTGGGGRPLRRMVLDRDIPRPVGVKRPNINYHPSRAHGPRPRSTSRSLHHSFASHTTPVALDILNTSALSCVAARGRTAAMSAAKTPAFTSLAGKQHPGAGARPAGRLPRPGPPRVGTAVPPAGCGVAPARAARWHGLQDGLAHPQVVCAPSCAVGETGGSGEQRAPDPHRSGPTRTFESSNDSWLRRRIQRGRGPALPGLSRPAPPSQADGRVPADHRTRMARFRGALRPAQSRTGRLRTPLRDPSPA